MRKNSQNTFAQKGTFGTWDKDSWVNNMIIVYL